MAPIPAGYPVDRHQRSVPVGGAILVAALLAGSCGAVDSKTLVHPEIRLGVEIGPHIQTVQDSEVTDRHAYTIAGGVYVDLPLGSVVGVVLGVGMPYRFGTSRFPDGGTLNTENLGGQGAAGLSFHLGSMVILESLFVGSYGHAHASYERDSFPHYGQSDYGSFADYTWQWNLLFHEGQGVKVGISAAYDWYRQRLHDVNGDPYDARAKGLAGGFIGGIEW